MLVWGWQVVVVVVVGGGGGGGGVLSLWCLSTAVTAEFSSHIDQMAPGVSLAGSMLVSKKNAAC